MADKPIVLATIALNPDGEATLSPHVELRVAPDTQAATICALARDAHGIIARSKLPDDIVEHAPKLKGIVRHGVGLDFIPVEAATKRGIPVANLPGSNAQAVAEYCFSALLHLRRPLGDVNRSLRADGWTASRAVADAFPEIGGSTLGIIGVGTVGRRVAQMARLGFGMRVLGVSRSGKVPEGVERVGLEVLFAGSDAIVVSCALTDATRGLVSAALISRMRPDAVLVNVSRGAVIETAAVVEALNARKIGGAALDVFDVQPLPSDNPLLDCPSLLLTPHLAGITATSLRNMSVGAAEEMLRILKGEDPKNLVNPDYKKHI